MQNRRCLQASALPVPPDKGPDQWRGGIQWRGTCTGILGLGAPVRKRGIHCEVRCRPAFVDQGCLAKEPGVAPACVKSSKAASSIGTPSDHAGAANGTLVRTLQVGPINDSSANEWRLTERRAAAGTVPAGSCQERIEPMTCPQRERREIRASVSRWHGRS